MSSTTLQKQRPQEQKTGSWATVFPNEQVTSQQSALFVKKLLAVAVSNIAYLRAIFPENAFGDRCLEDLNLKVLRDDSTCPGACQVIQWIKGCFDALDKKFLKSIIIGIYLDAENPDSVIESYTFKFSYTGKGGGVDVYRNDQHLSGVHSAAETKKATMRLLRTIVVLTQSLHSLPDDIMMTMKLLYDDDVTPIDYEPPGFMAAMLDNFTFENEPINIKVGDVSTPFHTVKMRIKTDAKQFDMVNEEGKKEGVSTTSNSIDSHDSGDQVMAEDAANQQPKPTEADDVPDMTPIKPVAAVEGRESEGVALVINDEKNCVRCPCGCNEDDGMMILCAICNNWQHAVCFAIVKEELAPLRHICSICANPQVADLLPTDPSLHGLSEVATQAQCLWRRALMACTETKRMLQKTLSSRLGIEMTVASGLLNRLEKEGYLKPALKGKRLGKLVEKEKVLKEAFPKYLQLPQVVDNYQKQSQTSVCNEVIKVSGVMDDIADKEIEKLAVQTKEIKLSGRKGKRNNKGKLVSEQKEQKQRKGKKRVKSRTDESEFEVSNSQETSQEINYATSGKRRKASIVSRPIMV